jgi:cyclopropane fatty-acyl-phospholipid synthase-like methyltransferase
VLFVHLKKGLQMNLKCFLFLAILAVYNLQSFAIQAQNPKEDYWKAEEYFQNSSSQKDAASDLLQHVTIIDNDLILDVGCGDGKITAELASKVPNGLIIGIDNSPSMIEFAQANFPSQQYTTLSFVLKDA